MTATATVKETPDGWYIVIVDSANSVIRIEGNRATVALTPDDDGTTPLAVELAPEENA